MSYNFKNLADVELLSTMPETANVLVEVDGTTKRAPQVQPVDEISQIVTSESLAEVPEGAEVLGVVDGEIKRVPASEVGGAGMLNEMSDVVLFKAVHNAETGMQTICNKTFAEVISMLRNNEMRLALMYGLSEGYMIMPFNFVLPRNSSGDYVLDGVYDTVTNIAFSIVSTSGITNYLYLLNDDTVTMSDPCSEPK